MNEFFDRIVKSILNIAWWLFFLLAMVFIAAVIVLVGFVVPIYFLDKAHVSLPYIYVGLLMIGLPIYGEWSNIKFWFCWQFIEPFKSRKKVTCMTHTEGFTIGKEYKLQGVAGEYIQLINDSGKKVIVDETNFWSDK